MLMQEATQSRTGLSWFRPWGRTSSKECARALYCLAPGVPVVGGTSEAKEGGELPSLLLEEELIEASANIGAQKSVCALRVVLSVVFYRMG